MVKSLVSVVVPTYNREEPLCQTVELLMRQDYDPYEIVIVDQTREHEPSTERFLAGTCSDSRVRYFKLDVPNLPGARNFGIERARGDIIIFVDDDVQMEKDFVFQHVKNYIDPVIGAVAGGVLDRGHPRLVRHRPRASVSFFGKDTFILHSEVRGLVKGVRGCNMSFRKGVFSLAGLFDTRFTQSALREEADMAIRIMRSGLLIAYDPEAKLYHLEDSGGCRTHKATFSESVFRNETLFHLKSFPRVSFPLFAFFLAMKYVMWPAVRQRMSPSEVAEGFRRLVAGVRSGSAAYHFRGVQ
jgi:glycosyltransferase involved in cell wall biosynthesis